MKLSDFVQGSRYSRADVFDTLGINPRPTGGNWYTGYHTQPRRRSPVPPRTRPGLQP